MPSRLRPDLRPEYPVGLPTFEFRLESPDWKGRTMIDLKEVLKHCFSSGSDQDCIRNLMIARIRRHCIIVTFAVLPHLASQILQYLTNDDVIMSMKKEGITIDISSQLMKYKETTDCIPTLKVNN